MQDKEEIWKALNFLYDRAYRYCVNLGKETDSEEALNDAYRKIGDWISDD